MQHRDTSRLDAAIERAEAQYGVVVPARVAIRICGSRATYLRALESGALVPLGRRGGTGERTFATADVVRYLAAPDVAPNHPFNDRGAA